MRNMERLNESSGNSIEPPSAPTASGPVDMHGSPDQTRSPRRETIKRTLTETGRQRRRPRSGPSVPLVNHSVSNMASRMQQQQDFYSQQQQQQLQQQQQRRSRLSGGRTNPSSRTRPASSSYTESNRNNRLKGDAIGRQSPQRGENATRVTVTKRIASATLHRERRTISQKTGGGGRDFKPTFSGNNSGVRRRHEKKL